MPADLKRSAICALIFCLSTRWVTLTHKLPTIVLGVKLQKWAFRQLSTPSMSSTYRKSRTMTESDFGWPCCQVRGENIRDIRRDAEPFESKSNAEDASPGTEHSNEVNLPAFGAPQRGQLSHPMDMNFHSSHHTHRKSCMFPFNAMRPDGSVLSSTEYSLCCLEFTLHCTGGWKANSQCPQSSLKRGIPQQSCLSYGAEPSGLTVPR